MKSTGILVLLLGLFLALAPAPAHADRNRGCKTKEEIILKKLEIAKSHGNRGEIRGLERALVNVRTWCADRDLGRDAREKVADKQEKVAERKEELRSAIAGGDKASKIEKRRRKLAEAEEELAEALVELDVLQ